MVINFFSKTFLNILIISLILTSCTTLNDNNIKVLSKTKMQKESMDKALRMCYDVLINHNKNNSKQLNEEFNNLKKAAGNIWYEYEKKDHTTFWSSDTKRYIYYVFAPVTLGIILLPTSNSGPEFSYERPSYQDIIGTCDRKIGNVVRIRNGNLFINNELVSSNFDKKRKIKESEVRKILATNKKGRVIDGIFDASAYFYNTSDRATMNSSVIIFKNRYHKEKNLSVESIQGSYAIYSNHIFTIAVKKSKKRHYLKDSLLAGKYYKFLGIKTFNTGPKQQKNELLVYEEITDLSKYDRSLVRSMFYNEKHFLRYLLKVDYDKNNNKNKKK